MPLNLQTLWFALMHFRLAKSELISPDTQNTDKIFLTDRLGGKESWCTVGQSNKECKETLTAVFLETGAMPCQSRLNPEIQPFVVEGIGFTHN